MVTLREINDDNFRDVIGLEVNEKQRLFVAPNVVSLAQAWLAYNQARPFAIYADETLVGFFMAEVDKKCNPPSYGIWRFMIDKRYQGKGYGRQALALAVEYLKDEGATEISLSSDPENAVAWNLYEHAGFVRTGEMHGSEALAILKAE